MFDPFCEFLFFFKKKNLFQKNKNKIGYPFLWGMLNSEGEA
jgi:hypothetical protein